MASLSLVKLGVGVVIRDAGSDVLLQEKGSNRVLIVKWKKFMPFVIGLDLLKMQVFANWWWSLIMLWLFLLFNLALLVYLAQWASSLASGQVLLEEAPPVMFSFVLADSLIFS